MTESGKVIKVLLADDHEMLRDGLKSIIEGQADMEVIAAVGNGRSAVRMAQTTQPNVVVMDIGMPDLNGIDATRQIVGDSSAPRVLGLSMHKEQSMVGSMLRAGASGYLVKNCAGRELVTAIRTVAAGETYISPMVAGDLVQEYVRSRPEPTDSIYATISEREREVLQLIAEGHHTKIIADRLNISPKTVLAHREKRKAEP